MTCLRGSLVAWAWWLLTIATALDLFTARLYGLRLGRALCEVTGFEAQ